jgi:hypothetical protein
VRERESREEKFSIYNKFRALPISLRDREGGWVEVDVKYEWWRYGLFVQASLFSQVYLLIVNSLLAPFW